MQRMMRARVVAAGGKEAAAAECGVWASRHGGAYHLAAGRHGSISATPCSAPRLRLVEHLAVHSYTQLAARMPGYLGAHLAHTYARIPRSTPSAHLCQDT